MITLSVKFGHFESESSSRTLFLFLCGIFFGGELIKSQTTFDTDFIIYTFPYNKICVSLMYSYVLYVSSIPVGWAPILPLSQPPVGSPGHGLLRKSAGRPPGCLGGMPIAPYRAYRLFSGISHVLTGFNTFCRWCFQPRHRRSNQVNRMRM